MAEGARAPQPLTRSLGLTAVVFLTLSVTTPASSVFVIIPGMLQVAGTGALAAMAIATLVCVATGVIYAELSSAFPVAGGEYVAVARTMGPLAGFVMLGVNVFNNLLFVPVAALGISAVLATLVPGLPQIPLAIVVVAAATLIAILRIRVNAIVTGVFLIAEIVALVVITGLGALHSVRSVGALAIAPVIAAPEQLVPASAVSIGLGTSIAIFALNGYGAAVYFGEELHEAPRRIAPAILVSLTLALLLEILPLAAGIAGAPDLRSFLTAADPFGQLVAARGGSTVAGWVAIGVVAAIINAIIAWVLACARFFYGTGRDGSWGRPLDQWLTVIHPRFGSPWIGTLLIGGVGIVCCFVPVSTLLVLSGQGLVAIYAGMCIAAMAGRRSGATADAPYRMPLYPVAPVLTLMALGYVVWTSWLDPAEGRPALLMTGAQIALSAAYYWLFLKPRGGWQAVIPQDQYPGGNA